MYRQPQSTLQIERLYDFWQLHQHRTESQCLVGHFARGRAVRVVDGDVVALVDDLASEDEVGVVGGPQEDCADGDVGGRECAVPEGCGDWRAKVRMHNGLGGVVSENRAFYLTRSTHLFQLASMP